MNDRKCWIEHSGIVLHSVGDFDVIDCESCGFKHIIPIPGEKELRHIYRHEYHVKDKPLMLQHQLEDKEWLDETNDARLRTLEKILGRTGRLLDVGSGNGFFLQKAKERGWETKGIEISEKAAEYSKSQGLDVECASFDRNSVEKLEKFDVIHMGDVLEHVPHPKEVLDLCCRQLLPGGLIAVGVPNDYSTIQRILHEDLDTRPWWVAPPHHINYFDRKSLEYLLIKCNMTPVHSETAFPMELFLLMGQNYLDDPELGRKCHTMRKQLELNLSRTGNRELLDKLYESFANMGMGRNLLVIAKKHN